MEGQSGQMMSAPRTYHLAGVKAH